MEKIKRPILVWIAQAALLICSALLLINGLYLVVVMGTDVLSIGMLFVLGMILVLAVIPLIVFWGLARRKAYGRYLTQMFLTFIWILLVRNLIFSLNSWPGLVVMIYYPGRLALWMLYGIFMILLPLLVISFAFNKKVANFLLPSMNLQ